MPYRPLIRKSQRQGIGIMTKNEERQAFTQYVQTVMKRYTKQEILSIALIVGQKCNKTLILTERRGVKWMPE